MRKIEDDAVRAIKAAGAHHCLVWTRGESEPRKVAISDRRNKWQQLEAVLSQLDWTRIDACDKSGATLHTIIAEMAARQTAYQAEQKRKREADE